MTGVAPRRTPARGDAATLAERLLRRTLHDAVRQSNGNPHVAISMELRRAIGGVRANRQRALLLTITQHAAASRNAMPALVVALMAYASYLVHAAHWRRAAHFYFAAIPWAKVTDVPRLLARCYWRFAVCAKASGREAAAHRAYDAAIGVAEGCGDVGVVVRMMSGKANLLLLQGDFDGAHAELTRARARAEVAGSLRLMAPVAHELGLLCHERARALGLAGMVDKALWAEAASHFLLAFRLTPSIPWRRRIAVDAGRLLRDLGLLRAATAALTYASRSRQPHARAAAFVSLLSVATVQRDAVAFDRYRLAVRKLRLSARHHILALLECLEGNVVFHRPIDRVDVDRLKRLSTRTDEVRELEDGKIPRRPKHPWMRPRACRELAKLVESLLAGDSASIALTPPAPSASGLQAILSSIVSGTIATVLGNWLSAAAQALVGVICGHQAAPGSARPS